MKNWVSSKNPLILGISDKIHEMSRFGSMQYRWNFNEIQKMKSFQDL